MQLRCGQAWQAWLERQPRRRGARPLALLALIWLAVAGLALSACSGLAGAKAGPSTADAAQESPSGTPGASPVTTPAQTAAGAVTPSAPAAPAIPAGLSRADVQAGVLSPEVAPSGTGTLVTVPGDVPAPSSSGRLVRVKVQVEKGLAIDGRRFAAFALRTLNDRRSWAHGGALRFSRVDGGGYDVRLVLASPDTSARLCRPLVTYGKLSCHAGDATVLTVYRYVKAIPGYGSDRTGYRQYLVNHEVGHALGHGHEYCSRKGALAPVMQQQTKGLQGCRPNPWPHP